MEDYNITGDIDFYYVYISFVKDFDMKNIAMEKLDINIDKYRTLSLSIKGVWDYSLTIPLPDDQNSPRYIKYNIVNERTICLIIQHSNK